MNIVIKPENIMLKSKDKDKYLEIKLIDFGVKLRLKKRIKH
jgi:serine/threonine protein kinase